mmetsp:Transcript_82534/g.238481  ORF Transcript_82534/g.238481 Transcript_82534/m.238481 type:complete len:510 (-) Transcript_82534:63-1592(-)
MTPLSCRLRTPPSALGIAKRPRESHLPHDEAAMAAPEERADAAGHRREAVHQNLLLLRRAVPEGGADDDVRMLASCQLLQVRGEPLGQVSTHSFPAMLDHALDDEIPEAMLRQLGNARQQLLDERRRQLKRAMLEQTLEDARSGHVHGGTNSATAKLGDDKGHQLVGCGCDEELQHVVAMRRGRQLPGMASHTLDDQALDLEQPRARRSRGELQCASRQALHVRGQVSERQDRLEKNGDGVEFEHLVKAVAQLDVPSGALAAGKQGEEFLALRARPHGRDHRLPLARGPSSLDGDIHVGHGITHSALHLDDALAALEAQADVPEAHPAALRVKLRPGGDFGSVCMMSATASSTRVLKPRRSQTSSSPLPCEGKSSAKSCAYLASGESTRAPRLAMARASDVSAGKIGRRCCEKGSFSKTPVEACAAAAATSSIGAPGATAETGITSGIGLGMKWPSVATGCIVDHSAACNCWTAGAAAKAALVQAATDRGAGNTMAMGCAAMVPSRCIK